jgi:hypothetical protein
MSATPPPPKGPLTDWLREEARAPFETPRGDVGDQVALQWLPELAEHDSRVGFAVQNLLREGDPVIVDRLLQITNNAPMRRAVLAVLPDVAQTLGAIDAAGGFSLLGRAVHALQLLKGVGAVPDATLQLLHDIDRPEHGWPTSTAVGLAVARNRFLDRIIPTLTTATPEQIDELAWVFLANADEDAVTAVLKHVGAHAPLPLREQFGAAIKRDLEAQDEARKQMLGMSVPLAPAESGAKRWLRYAGELGVAP